MPAPDKKNFTHRPQYQLAMYWYNQGKADLETELTRLNNETTRLRNEIIRLQTAPRILNSNLNSFM